MWWTEYWHGPWMFFGPLIGILFMVACMVGMYYVMVGHANRHERAIDILRKRLARGEIDQAEFEARRRVLDA
jgi:putative membrane protein